VQFFQDVIKTKKGGKKPTSPVKEEASPVAGPAAGFPDASPGGGQLTQNKPTAKDRSGAKSTLAKPSQAKLSKNLSKTTSKAQLLPAFQALAGDPSKVMKLSQQMKDAVGRAVTVMIKQ